MQHTLKTKKLFSHLRATQIAPEALSSFFHWKLASSEDEISFFASVDGYLEGASDFAVDGSKDHSALLSVRVFVVSLMVF